MIVIKPLDPSNLSDAGQCDGMFLVDNKLVLSVESDIIHYTIVSTPPYEKQYPSRHLYHGQNINPVEIALYWYWHPETPSDPLMNVRSKEKQCRPQA